MLLKEAVAERSAVRLAAIASPMAVKTGTWLAPPSRGNISFRYPQQLGLGDFLLKIRTGSPYVPHLPQSSVARMSSTEAGSTTTSATPAFSSIGMCICGSSGDDVVKSDDGEAIAVVPWRGPSTASDSAASGLTASSSTIWAAGGEGKEVSGSEMGWSRQGTGEQKPLPPTAARVPEEAEMRPDWAAKGRGALPGALVIVGLSVAAAVLVAAINSISPF